LLKRNKALHFAPSYWVFPGGRVDSADGSFQSEDMEATAKQAAAREAAEEAGIEVDPKLLYHYCHWTTPTGDTRRYSTWFFHTYLPKKETRIEIDKSEIVDHNWIHPYEALKMHLNGHLPILPPTFISLQRIKNARTYDDVIAEFNRTGVVKAEPVVSFKDHVFYSLYEGDAGYETRDITKTSSKHRLVIDQTNRSYAFEYENCQHIPPVNGGVSFDLESVTPTLITQG
jgi:8-oxo-dGTP pyrophosphatase MutT (NUDIX family)